MTQDTEFVLPPNPKLLDLDEELIDAAGEIVEADAELMLMHLRDARQLLGLSRNDAAMAKASIVLASAALESNLNHLSAVGLAFADARPGLYSTPQLDFLRGEAKSVDERGQLVSRPLRQSLEDRLRTIPALLARAVGRQYELPKRSQAVRKLRATIARRDAIIHPRWDRYLHRPGWYEAAVAVDSVELYLQSVSSEMHPYLMRYFLVLGTIPPGWHKGEGVDVGYRTRSGRDSSSGFVKMGDIGLRAVITGEWRDASYLTSLALENGVEGDSEGSLLSRSALILLYAMVDGELAIIAQWKMAEDPDRFAEAESNFLNEVAVGIGHDGEVTVDQDKQSFKTRILGVPRVLARCVEGVDAVVDLGKQWGQALLRGQDLRNNLVHSPAGGRIPRISLRELLDSAKAVKSYLNELYTIAPKTFQVLGPLVKAFKLPADREVDQRLETVRKMRRSPGYDRPILFRDLKASD